MMELSTTKPATRETKYCNTIRMVVEYRGHATNAEVHADVCRIFPNVSATTVHRATARLASRGELGVAPADAQGAMRYDANLEPHDHFMCVRCGLLRDITIAQDVLPLITQKLEGCEISGNITISGICRKCRRHDQQ
ncbi:hypothetical protein EOL96_00740 [Candidatus Saccharibacteria bacterium]|nr:hypothetical protein [Candidatus Saccharibacteria bacterium]